VRSRGSNVRTSSSGNINRRDAAGTKDANVENKPCDARLGSSKAKIGEV
jgi:hypothetical protein